MGSVGCPRGYALGELLGSGSYGSVFKARKTSGHRDVVAVKRVDKTKLSKSESDNLVNEIALLKRLKHDHIVQMVDFSWDAANIYIVMEFCAGGDLSKFIKARTRLDERVCLAFLRQLALALRYLRSENVAHLDLKPSNILLMTPPTRLKLADFGFAQKLEMGEERNSVRGSPLYMAPEMINDRSYTAKADLWSVGVILYECLFGKAPYKSANVQELLDKVSLFVCDAIFKNQISRPTLKLNAINLAWSKMAFFVLFLCLYQVLSYPVDDNEDYYDESQLCPPGWTAEFSHCLFFGRNSVSWNSAVHKCRDLGAILAEPKTFNAIDAIKGNVIEDVWVGINEAKYFTSGVNVQRGLFQRDSNSTCGLIRVNSDRICNDNCQSKRKFVCQMALSRFE